MVQANGDKQVNSDTTHKSTCKQPEPIGAFKRHYRFMSYAYSNSN